ncbi:hypothetical protein [Streptomyces jumonjinensis]|uniref:hypothetical protein n=1 Tax=Streptomyces jumonjinensis TaxID=1945 RepID=UPI00378B4600
MMTFLESMTGKGGAGYEEPPCGSPYRLRRATVCQQLDTLRRDSVSVAGLWCVQTAPGLEHAMYPT